jgi:hypothetical protein
MSNISVISDFHLFPKLKRTERNSFSVCRWGEIKTVDLQHCIEQWKIHMHQCKDGGGGHIILYPHLVFQFYLENTYYMLSFHSSYFQICSTVIFLLPKCYRCKEGHKFCGNGKILSQAAENQLITFLPQDGMRSSFWYVLWCHASFHALPPLRYFLLRVPPSICYLSPLLLPSPPTMSWLPQCAPSTHSVSPSGAAHIVFWPNFISIHLASEFALLFSRIAWLCSGFQFV